MKPWELSLVFSGNKTRAQIATGPAARVSHGPARVIWQTPPAWVFSLTILSLLRMTSVSLYVWITREMITQDFSETPTSQPSLVLIAPTASMLSQTVKTSAEDKVFKWWFPRKLVKMYHSRLTLSENSTLFVLPKSLIQDATFQTSFSITSELPTQLYPNVVKPTPGSLTPQPQMQHPDIISTTPNAIIATTPLNSSSETQIQAGWDG